MNNLIFWGIGLIVVGLVLGLMGVGGVLTGALAWLGWVLLVVGIILAVIHVAGRGRTTGPRRV